MTKVNNSIYWFRKCLRLHDNPALIYALENSKTVYPVFILDPWFVKNAVSELLDDPIYRKRVTDLSIISKRFVGHKLAVQHIINYLHQNEAFHDNSRQTISTSTMSLLNRS